MIARNYMDYPMTGISSADYETLVVHLTEQVSSKLRFHGDEAAQAAEDALNQTWIDTMTAREWIAATGKRLDVDLSDIVGV